FNRRFDLATMLTRLAYVALRTEPLPFHLLKQGLS
ncbi:MAG: IS1595 family transposase, partial [Candidatus Adiutrix sp.]|nr:IS1595 family transposase [Candidatus Adiutrix sp.]MDR1921583.1 IS1595 family transposase [Candidatus Adiutrix sp.]MDR1922246.1 IS1595 family transposase [Candidatus Adiutrix sp.]